MHSMRRGGVLGSARSRVKTAPFLTAVTKPTLPSPQLFRPDRRTHSRAIRYALRRPYGKACRSLCHARQAYLCHICVRSVWQHTPRCICRL